MTGRERFLAAARHEIPDRLPISAMGIDNRQALAALLGCDASEVAERLGLDGMVVEAPYIGPKRQAADGTILSHWGTVSERYGGQRKYPIGPDATLDDIAKYPWPSPDDFDYEAMARDARTLAQRVALRGGGWNPLFCGVCDLMGMEEAMVAMAVNPELFLAIVDRIFTFVRARIRRITAACGDDLPVLGLGDDFSSQRGLMISPQDWRKFLKPRYAALFADGKAAGKVILFHSCGNIAEVLDDLVEIGMDIWQTVQLHTLPITPDELKARYGKRLAFFGAISTQRLPFATPDEISAEVTRVVRALGRGGGYIVSPDHCIKADVPPHNVLALYDTARAFRAEGYTR